MEDMEDRIPFEKALRGSLIQAIEGKKRTRAKRRRAALAGVTVASAVSIVLAGGWPQPTPRSSRRPLHRWRFNDAVLEAVDIKDRRVARGEFSDAFAPLFSRLVRKGG